MGQMYFRPDGFKGVIRGFTKIINMIEKQELKLSDDKKADTLIKCLNGINSAQRNYMDTDKIRMLEKALNDLKLGDNNVEVLTETKPKLLYEKYEKFIEDGEEENE